MWTTTLLQQHHHWNLRDLLQHSHHVDLQSELRSVPVLKLSSCERFTPLPDGTLGKIGCSVLSLNVRFAPLLEEAPEGIGFKVELDGAVGRSAGFSVSSALGIGISPDKSCSGSPLPFGLPTAGVIYVFYLFSWCSRHNFWVTLLERSLRATSFR